MLASQVRNSDGQPVDANTMCAEAGFQCHVTLTDAVWKDCVAWKSTRLGSDGQSEAGRLWDVLSMAFLAHTLAMGQGQLRREFEVLRVPRGGDEAKSVRLIWNLTKHDGEDVVVITDAFDE